MPRPRRTQGRVVLGAALAMTLAVAPTALARGRAIAASQRLHVTVTLRPRNPTALATYARAVSTPGSASYLHYLTPRQFARRFGPTRAELAVVRRSLQARGLHPGSTAAGGLSIPLRATVGELEHGLSVSLRTHSLRGRRTAIVANAPPSLGPPAARVVQSVLGLDTTSAPHPLFARAWVRKSRASLRNSHAASPHVITGGPQPCQSAQSVASAHSAHTADQIASAYDFSPLYDAGNRGIGVTVAIYELEPNSPTDIDAYQSCYGTHASVSYVPVDGGAGTGPGSGEAALDIEDLIGLAPGANVIVYQGPNSSSGGPGSGPYDTFAAIINQNRARVITVSWGECESALGLGPASAEATLFQQAAVQGQTIVAADGDNGSEDCGQTDASSPTALAVDDPSSQPFVTGVGGTTLQAIGPRPIESVWNDTGHTSNPLIHSGASGGGISSLWPMPLDQLQAAPPLNVLGAGRTGAQCDHSGGFCREVPDVAADADPSTGYVIYWSGGAAGEPSGWQSIGGTSAAAPVWAALMTLADASGACAGNPLGFAGPAIYRAASSGYAGDFNDVHAGSNDFTSTNGGAFTAGAGYDEASGLGSPNGAPLVAALCVNTLRLVSPGTPRLTAHATVSMRLRAEDPRGVGIDFHARGLPPGLGLSQTTGTISGRPGRPGSFLVQVGAQDAQGATSSTSFTINVGVAPRVSRTSVSGPRHRRMIAFAATAGRGAPAFERLSVALPRGLKLTSTRGVALKARGVRRPRFRAQLRHGTLQITLRRSLTQLIVSLSRPGLRVTSSSRPRRGKRGRSAGSLALVLVDAGSGTTHLQSKLAHSP